MRLRIALTSTFIFGILLIFCWPWLVGSAPTIHATDHAKVAFLVRFVIYTILLLLDFCATIILALILVRKTREEYRAQATENLKELIEGTLKDHEKKQR